MHCQKNVLLKLLTHVTNYLFYEWKLGMDLSLYLLMGFFSIENLSFEFFLVWYKSRIKIAWVRRGTSTEFLIFFEENIPVPSLNVNLVRAKLWLHHCCIFWKLLSRSHNWFLNFFFLYLCSLKKIMNSPYILTVFM